MDVGVAAFEDSEGEDIGVFLVLDGKGDGPFLRRCAGAHGRAGVRVRGNLFLKVQPLAAAIRDHPGLPEIGEIGGERVSRDPYRVDADGLSAAAERNHVADIDGVVSRIQHFLDAPGLGLFLLRGFPDDTAGRSYHKAQKNDKTEGFHGMA